MRKVRTKRTILYVILLVILLLLLLRACDGKGDRRVSVTKKDATVILTDQAAPVLITRDPAPPPLPATEEKPPSNSPGPAVSRAAVTAQSGDSDQPQVADTMTEHKEAKAVAVVKKKQPDAVQAKVPQLPVAVPASETKALHEDAPEADSAETLDETFTEPITGIKFILVRGGCYQMGTDHEQVFEGPMHEVCVDDYYLSKYEVTQKQWLTLKGRTQSNFYFNGKSHPTEWINWDEAQEFVRILNRRSKLTFRLPTEAEWEYAARSGGQDEKYAGTSDEDSLEDFAWYRANSNGQTRFIGIKKPNGLGLHDMSGNVREWCSDWYGKDYYGNSPRENPQGPDSGEYRVIRGGAWGLPRGLARTTYRDAAKPNQRRNDIGFRIALPVQ